jgi:phosphoribosylformylglycinamidine synthase
VYQANQAGWLRSAHDLSEGGLAVTAAEMSIGGRLGLQLTLDGQNAFREAFGETAGCILVEVATHHQTEFEELFSALPLRKLGQVISEPYLEIRTEQGIFLKLSIEQLLDAWKNQRNAEVNA